jgi:hypothetical protein
MQGIKFKNSSTIILNGQMYKGYTVGNLPKKFAFIYDEDEEKEGIMQWFNHKGLTYVEYNPSIWSYVQ